MVRSIRMKDFQVKATANAAGTAQATAVPVNGKLIEISAIPDTTNTPSANWDFTLQDRDSIQIFTSGSVGTSNKAFYPVTQLQDQTGSDVGSGEAPRYGLIPVKEELSVTMSNMGSGGVATLRFKYI